MQSYQYSFGLVSSLFLQTTLLSATAPLETSTEFFSTVAADFANSDLRD